jgi:hypothetical protein
MSAVGTEPWPLPTSCRRAARSAADGMFAVGPATEPISTHVSGFARSVRADDLAQGVLGRLAPDEIEDDVDVGGLLHVAERDDPAAGAAGGADHLTRAEVLGHPQREPAGVPRRAEDEHAAACERTRGCRPAATTSTSTSSGPRGVGAGNG